MAACWLCGLTGDLSAVCLGKKKNTEKQDYSKPTKSTGGKADVSLSLADNPKEQRLKQVTCWHYITGKDLGQGRGMENY